MLQSQIAELGKENRGKRQGGYQQDLKLESSKINTRKREGCLCPTYRSFGTFDSCNPVMYITIAWECRDNAVFFHLSIKKYIQKLHVARKGRNDSLKSVQRNKQARPRENRIVEFLVFYFIIIIHISSLLFLRDVSVFIVV